MTCPDCHPAFVAGLDLGEARRVEIDIRDAVQAVLHSYATEMLGMASASAIHGPAFSALVRDSGERE